MGSRSKLQYLDCDPKSELSDGRVIVRNGLKARAPKGCFYELDLYSRRFGSELNDDIEKLFFGDIDRRGASAVRSFIGGDLKAVHDHFRSFFTYLNAQKLRTPKGLDWIKNRYPDLSQGDLMVEMQKLRHMYSTMWFECVREIVSAEHSDVKFIVTDHPVTAFNVSCLPDSSACLYPEDPSVGLKGTQTVFALDADHCLLLTNFEYARDPSGVDPVSARENERYLSQTLTRTDTMIRTRVLTREEVVGINLLLKAGSRKYVAGHKESWLFPEQIKGMMWKDIGELLLPPRDQLGQFGGEIVIGFGDGSTRYQDPFGRTDKFHEFLKKKVRSEPLAANEQCGCGSGRRYKKCCRGMAPDDRLPWDVYSIRERNMTFANAVVDILGFNEGKNWEDMRRDLSNEQVKSVHELLEGLWPKDTNIADLLPRPDERVFRGVYLGFADPRTVAVGIISSLLYFDEILMLNPFSNPVHYSHEYSPTKSPAQHKSQMLKNVSLLWMLQPFIEAGLVHFVPDPMEFSGDFRRVVMEMIEERGANWDLKPDERQSGQELLRDDAQRQFLRLPEDYLRRQIRETQPGIGAEGVERVILSIRQKLASDPLALLQPVPVGEDGEILGLRGINLELALFMAHLTGAAVYTDEPAYWRQLHEQTSYSEDVDQHVGWVAMADKLKSLRLLIELSPSINFEAKNAGKLARMRRVFRHMWNMALTDEANAEFDEKLTQLMSTLENSSKKANMEWENCDTKSVLSERFRRQFDLSISPTGFSMNTVHRLLVTSGRKKYVGLVPMALFLSME